MAKFFIIRDVETSEQATITIADLKSIGVSLGYKTMMEFKPEWEALTAKDQISIINEWRESNGKERAFESRHSYFF